MKRSFLIISILCWQFLIALPSFAQEPDTAKIDKAQATEKAKQLFQFFKLNSKLDDIKKFVENGADLKYKDGSGSSVLHIAARFHCSDEIFNYLIGKGADVNAKNNLGQTPLFDAINNDDLNAAKILLERGADINARDQSGKTPLRYVIQKNPYFKMVRLLVEKGAEVDAADNEGTTLLTMILSKRYVYNRFIIAKYLIEHGANINVKTSNGLHVLELAVLKRAGMDVETFELLMEKCDKIDWSKRPAIQPITWVLSNQLLAERPMKDLKKYLNYFIKNGADVKLKGGRSQTPLEFALINNNSNEIHDLFMFLVENGADINIFDKDKRSVLTLVAFGKFVDVRTVKYLVENGADVNSKDDYEGSPLHAALSNVNSTSWITNRKNTIEAIKYLVEHGADVNAETKLGGRPITSAISAGDFELFKYFVANKAEVNFLSNNGNTPIYSALSGGVSANRIDMIKLLIEHGCDINVKNKSGDTPINHAARFQFDVDAVKFFCSTYTVDVNCKNNDGTTPLMHALRSNLDFDRIKCLVDLGADVKMKDNNGKTPLHYLLTSKNIYDAKPINNNVIQILIKNGVNINADYQQNESFALAIVKCMIRNNNKPEHLKEVIKTCNIDIKITFGDNKETLLHHAASYTNKAEMIKYLIDQGISVNVQDRFGSTPLHAAALRGKSIEAVRTLIASGADINAKDDNNATPLHDAAEHNPSTEILDILIKSGADINAKDIHNMTPIDTIGETNKEQKETILKKAAKK